jgi:aspartate aminotransferase
MPKISHRARGLAASPIRKLAALADAAEKRGVTVHHLNIGQPDIETPLAMRARLGHVPSVIAYSPSEGTTDYLDVLERYYDKRGLGVARSEILATTGASEALLFALEVATDPGDDVLVCEPFYTNYATFAKMASAEVNAIATRAEDGFHLPDPSVWRARLGPRTRAFLLCNPSNPTGTVYTREEVQAVAHFCEEHDLFFIVDEVYREFAYDGRVATSALSLSHAKDRVVVVDSLSKRYGACGIRLGCLITHNRSFMAACLKLAQARLSPPGLAQLAALGIPDIPDDYTREVVQEYQARRDVLFDGLSAIPGVFLKKPEGAFYFVARLPVADADDFARYLLEEFEVDRETVMVAPAAGFYATPGLGLDEVRIAYVLDRTRLARSAALLAKALDRYANRSRG